MCHLINLYFLFIQLPTGQPICVFETSCIHIINIDSSSIAKKQFYDSAVGSQQCNPINDERYV